MRIAFAGNPNSGKTSMYNALTGRNEKVGNWAGVTVDRKEAKIKKLYAKEWELLAVDLPGAYSMSPFTGEESITSAYIKEEKPDVIVNIVDATNLSRSLFFTTQLLELGVPVVVALNKADINEKQKTQIDTGALSEALGCPVVETVCAEGSLDGLKELVQTAVAQAGKGQKAPYRQADIDLSDKSSVETEDRKRFSFVNDVVASVQTRQNRAGFLTIHDQIDKVLCNRFLGIPIFAAVMFLVFYISQTTLGTWISEWLVGQIELFQAWIRYLLTGADVAPVLQALLVDGIIGGVGAVIGFLPLVMIMYFLIALLEDCGYMARVSVVLDPFFKKVGLNGKSVISFVIGTGCAIPGIMACRTIRNERERRATAMLTPFMPCGAKLPVIGLFAGEFFPGSKWVGVVMYLAGILLILLGALLINGITGNKGKKSYFIMELPEYKLPSLRRAVGSMCSRGWSYVVKAGTVILLCNTVIQIMQSFTWTFQVAQSADVSILASIAKPVSVLLIPLGFGAWQIAAASVTGFIAKENVVATLAVCYGVANITNDQLGLSQAAALACLMFNLFTPPCFAAIGAMNAEIKDKKWLFGGIGLQLATGYMVAFMVYHVGTLLTKQTVGVGFVPGLIAVVCMVAVMAALYIRGSLERK